MSIPIDQQEELLGKTFVKGDYLLKFVRDDSDLNAVLALRFRVFNLELNEGLIESYSTELDRDPFDQICHHLMLIHKPTGKAIGTYRMQTQEMAFSSLGWYSAQEYDFNSMPKEVLNGAVELGRACLDRGHRNLPVLYLLWKGIGWYLKCQDKRYFFGCASITSQDPVDGQKAFHFLKNIISYIRPFC